MNDSISRSLSVLLILCFLGFPSLMGQIVDEESEWQTQTSTPSAIDFSKLFETEKTTRDEFEEAKRRRNAEIREKLSQPGYLEGVVEPNEYRVGPGDIFSFNVWGAMEMMLPVIVSPEGTLNIPSVGEIEVNGLSLAEVKSKVIESSKPFYKKSQVSISLESLRFFRVHVVGEVKYPGTYMANPTDRISRLIEEAGGITERANKIAIELHRKNGKKLTFDFADFEAHGQMASNAFVQGGDVVFVPLIDRSAKSVVVEGDFRRGGRYQISENENLDHFVERIGPFARSTNFSQITIIRRQDDQIQMIRPWTDGKEESLTLENGDRVVLPSSFVYVKGAVRNPGAYPFIANLTARDYAGMAGGDYQSSRINGVKVYQAQTGKTIGGPETPVEAGDVVDLPQSIGNRFRDVATVVTTITSIILSARAVGLIGNSN